MRPTDDGGTHRADRAGGEGAAHGIDVLVVGGVGVDTIVRVPSLPLPVADTVHVPPMRRYAGHSGSGWALGLHALGVRTHLLDLVGDDLEAGIVRERFTTAGLPFTGVVVPEGTKRSVNLVADDGSRMSFHDGRGQVLHPGDRDCHRDLLATTRHLHVTINDWTRAALRDAVSTGRTVSTDLNDWDGRNPYHEEFAHTADLVLLSTARLADRRDEVVASILEHGRARLVVTTSGASGCTVHRRGTPPVSVPAVRLEGREPVDTNGAGDAFGAAYLAEWLTGASPEQAARSAVVAGAWACGSAGTNADPIDRARLVALTASVPPPVTPLPS